MQHSDGPARGIPSVTRATGPRGGPVPGPPANAAEIAGSCRNACTVRTFSRAADNEMLQRHASHSAQFGNAHFAQRDARGAELLIT
jgi:hypothetical protein